MITVKRLTWGKFLAHLKKNIKWISNRLLLKNIVHRKRYWILPSHHSLRLSPHKHPFHKIFWVSQAQKETEPAWKLWQQITYSTCRTKLTVLCIPLSPLCSLSSFKWFPGNCNNMDSITACLLLCSIWSPLASSQRGCFWWISNISGVQRVCLCISDIVTNWTSLLKAHGCSETPEHSCSNPLEVSYYYGHLDRNILIYAWLGKLMQIHLHFVLNTKINTFLS